MRISVVIPAFNEAGNIGRLVEETYGAVPRDMLGEVIVIDDASDDGTAAEVKALLPRHGSLRYLRHGTPRRPECGIFDRGPCREISRDRHHGR